MLATRISFMNELSRVAELVGADIELVRKGIGGDPRIGTQFLYAGAGYGGSCFPKDVKALIRSASDAGHELTLLSAVETVNEAQKQVLADKVVQRFGKDLSGKRFALWGLAFKPGTDDMREAPSRVLIERLTSLGAQICAYDPVAMDEAKRAMPDQVGLSYASSASETLEGSDALLIVTEWKEFRSPDFDAIRHTLREPLVFDGRNLFEPPLLKSLGIEYISIGRVTEMPQTERRMAQKTER